MKVITKLAATVFYVGFFPYAPGTVGSALGLAFYFFLASFNLPQVWYLVVGLLLALVGIFFGGFYEAEKGEKDPAEVVLDEFAAIFLLAALAKPIFFVQYALLFALFRLFDVWKPFPIKGVQRLRGGLGIMLDDLVAALYSLIVYFLVHLVYPGL